MCKSCGSCRMVGVWGRSDDDYGIDMEAFSVDYRGFIPDDMGIGGGEISFSYCLGCGKIAGNFPLPPSKLEWE